MSYVVYKPYILVKLDNYIIIGLSRRDILAAIVPLTGPAYKQDSCQVSTIISNYLIGTTAWEHVHDFN